MTNLEYLEERKTDFEKILKEKVPDIKHEKQLTLMSTIRIMKALEIIAEELCKSNDKKYIDVSKL